jgi:hypothetical protein
MKKMKRPAVGADNAWTLGDLVSLAFDVTPDSKTAMDLLRVLLGGRDIQINRGLNSSG